MSVLAVYLERLGIATVVIGLIRLHLQKIAPPRALWVPFELGRPLGGWADSGQIQLRVLTQALALLDQDKPGPVQDFVEDDPAAADDPLWTRPDTGVAVDMRTEMQALQGLREQAVEQLGGSAYGVSGLAPVQAVEWLDKFVDSKELPALDTPDHVMSANLRSRFCADDIKLYYVEAAMAGANPSSRQIADWFWNHTLAGKRLRQLREASLEAEDSTRQLIGSRFIVPGAWL